MIGTLDFKLVWEQRHSGAKVAKRLNFYRCQAKFLTSVKFLTYYFLSVILLVRVKE